MYLLKNSTYYLLLLGILVAQNSFEDFKRKEAMAFEDLKNSIDSDYISSIWKRAYIFRKATKTFIVINTTKIWFFPILENMILNVARASARVHLKFYWSKEWSLLNIICLESMTISLKTKNLQSKTSQRKPLFRGGLTL